MILCPNRPGTCSKRASRSNCSGPHLFPSPRRGGGRRKGLNDWNFLNELNAWQTADAEVQPFDRTPVSLGVGHEH